MVNHYRSRYRWWIVAAATCGLITGSGVINVYCFGVFLKPISADLGVSRTMLSSGLLFNTVLTSLGNLVVGTLLDRYGTRRVLIPGVLLFAMAVASYSLLQAHPVGLIFLIYGLAGLAGSAQTPVAYARLVSSWFDRQRGLALGISISGVGIGASLIPQVAHLLIISVGWRYAYLGLAVAVLVIAFVPVVLLARDPPIEELVANQQVTDSYISSVALPGSTLAESLSSWRFYAMFVAFFISTVAINGTLSSAVPILSDRGIPVGTATLAVSGSGIAVIAGRIISGWCLDRFFGAIVAICFFAIPMIGLLLLSYGGAPLAFVGAILAGFGIGAEIDIMAFFVGRYFGLRSYGRIYGVMVATIPVASGLGSYLMSRSFDRNHDYGSMLGIFEGLLVLTCLFLVSLGSYRFPATHGSTRTSTS